jgi:BirA family biotin operon repressor/biotin-[acetyl-CoA-carboxylase] ligase
MPNDIYVDGRKVAGVLVESRTASDGKYVAVAGWGECESSAPDFPGEFGDRRSLRIATGRQIQRSHLAVALLRKLETDYRALRGLVARNC